MTGEKKIKIHYIQSSSSSPFGVDPKETFPEKKRKDSLAKERKKEVKPPVSSNLPYIE